MKPLVLLFLLATSAAEARVFSFKESTLGVMLRGTGGTSNIADDAFANSSGSGTATDDSSKYQYSGELGAVLGMGENFNLRLGAEVIKHHPVEGSGKNASSGQDRFQLESDTFVFNPNVAFEFMFKGGQSTRYFAELGVGYSMVDVENKYDMNATGQSELGVDDFNEKMSGTAISYLLGVGLETTMLDNVNLSLEGGYRYCKVSELKYTGDVNNIVKPTGAKKGEAALNNDGSKRQLDLSGFFVGASLRFYLHFL